MTNKKSLHDKLAVEHGIVVAKNAKFINYSHWQQIKKTEWQLEAVIKSLYLRRVFSFNITVFPCAYGYFYK